MSYTEKHDVTTKEEWMTLVDENDIGRGQMNKLIMNYLVTGKLLSFVARSLKVLV
jgi:hypothetical protein